MAEDKRVYGMLVPFIRRGGKRIRPALCLLSCGSCGGDRRSAVEPAAIIELFHNFTLIHDDIEDNSLYRRGEPTLHVSHGIPIALNSGDALYTLLWKKLVGLRLTPSRLIRLQKLYTESFKRVVDGQGVELSWIRSGRFDVSEKEYTDMINGKTSALIGLSCEAGAILAGAGKKQSAALRRYGESIGAAFQIQDDVLNVTGDFEKYKKEIGGDITEGKRTLMVVHCLSKAPAGEKKALTDILSRHTADKADIATAIELLKKHGSVDYARRRALDLVSAAKSELGSLPPSDDKRSLILLADYVVSREK
ncbi:MAG: polyprenyl synthetase family protein [Candidatus Micrarchaeia archaeon]